MANLIQRLYKLTLPVILLLCIFQFIVSNDLASVGASVEEMDKNADRTREENQLLLSQVSTMRSLDTIEAKAKEAGFVKATTFLTISENQSVALR